MNLLFILLCDIVSIAIHFHISGYTVLYPLVFCRNIFNYAYFSPNFLLSILPTISVGINLLDSRLKNIACHFICFTLV